VINLLLLIGEITILYFFSAALTQNLYLVFLLVFRNRHVAVSLVTGLLFPGTVIHELSHLFTAEILGVHTGRLTLTPEAIEEKEVKTGSVAIAQTGPFRRAAIGLAPFWTGLIALGVLSYFLTSEKITQINVINNINIVKIILIYLIFTVSNTMFASPEDLKGLFPLMLTLVIAAGAAYASGFRFFLTGQALTIATQAETSLVHTLWIVLALNGVLLLISRLLIILTTKITHQRLRQ